MTDPLACVEAVIDTLGSRKTRFWTPWDTSEGQVSTPNPQEICGFGHFGQLDTLSETFFETIASTCMKILLAVTLARRMARARRVLSPEVSKVSKVSKAIK